jgi:hypothetical protein
VWHFYMWPLQQDLIPNVSCHPINDHCSQWYSNWQISTYYQACVLFPQPLITLSLIGYRVMLITECWSIQTWACWFKFVYLWKVSNAFKSQKQNMIEHPSDKNWSQIEVICCRVMLIDKYFKLYSFLHLYLTFIFSPTRSNLRLVLVYS